MKVKQISNNQYLVVLDKGDEIIAGLKKFHKEYTNGEVVCNFQAIGACENPTIGFLEEEGYHWETLKGEFEILSCMGNITMFGDEIIPHTHIMVSGKDMKTYGGHLKDAVISVTMECFVTVHEVKVSRKRDESFGINLINF